MTKGLLSLLYALVAIALQGILGHLGLADRFIPQFLVIFVVYLSFAEVNAFGCLMSFVVGLLLDFSSAVLVGPWAGSFVVIFCVLALLSRRLFIDSGLAAMVITFVSVVVANILFSLFGDEYPVLTWEYPQKVLGQALATALVAPILLGFLARRWRRASSAYVGRGNSVSAV
ncbi:MAG: rod shape-determining protein MreD [Pseudomonadota bacterium]|jgi:rod shape-determining protein MreD